MTMEELMFLIETKQIKTKEVVNDCPRSSIGENTGFLIQ